MTETCGISCCFDRMSKRMYRKYRKKGLGKTSIAIADSLTDVGLKGSTVLEIGCGFGALAIELVKRGASDAVGLDLSPKMVELANKNASEAGLSGSVSFRLGDGAAAELTPSKLVVLDSVLCCYPDMAALVENSCSAAESYYAISIPDDTRFVTRALKLFLPLQGLVFRRGWFRFYVHRAEAIRETVEGNGFEPESSSPVGWMWTVMVFRRV